MRADKENLVKPSRWRRLNLSCTYTELSLKTLFSENKKTKATPIPFLGGAFVSHLNLYLVRFIHLRL
jgi:hypothetical protein